MSIDNQRMMDLLRVCRSELFTEHQLIDEAEYAWLASLPSKATHERLKDYDALRAELAAEREKVRTLTEERDRAFEGRKNFRELLDEEVRIRLAAQDAQRETEIANDNCQRRIVATEKERDEARALIHRQGAETAFGWQQRAEKAEAERRDFGLKVAEHVLNAVDEYRINPKAPTDPMVLAALVEEVLR
jgi:hypothetical protein